MKILHLIIYSKSKYSDDVQEGVYENMYKVLSKYYKKYNNNVKTYFIKYNNNVKKTYGKDYIINDDIIHIDGEESFIPGILEKCIVAFKIFSNIEYDYMVRSNISTIIEFNNLITYLNNKPIEYYGSGKLVNLQWNGGGINDSTWYNTIFASGTSIILTNTAVKNIISDEEKMRKNIIDDVSIGIYVREYHKDIKPHQIDSKYFEEVPLFFKDTDESINNYLKTIKDKPIIFYRNKCLGIKGKDRIIDSKQMGIITNFLEL